MKVARFTVNRPIFTTMTTLIVIILGGIALSRLPIDLMPDITYPTLSISTAYENASPEEIEELVTRPIEEAMSAVPGVEEITSTSSEGQSNVRITFTWGTNLDAASSDIRDRLDRVIPQLPEDAARPALFKFDLASFPVLILGAASDLDPIKARELVENQIQPRIERLPGVAALDVWGGLEREVHVQIDYGKIRAHGLSLDEVIAAIRAANVNIPAGAIEQGNDEITIRTPGEYTDLEQLKRTVVAWRDGVPLSLDEIANVEDSFQKITRVVRVNGSPGLRLAVRKQSGTNTVDVARRVMAEVKAVNEEFPMVRIVPIIDTSDYIQRSILNLGRSALFGGVLAIFVLLFFLRSIRSTIVIAVAIPVSIVATFALMFFCGFTLNLMTLGGLALGVGMLVDNAIVVLENVYRQREEGAIPQNAAIDGTEEVTAAIVASTLTTLVVFMPMVFMRGISGVMFQQMALVVSFSLLCSLLVAISLVPMLASKLMRRESVAHHERRGLSKRWFALSGRFFAWIENEYKALLHLSLRHRVLVVVLTVLLVAGAFALIPLVGQELMPESDENEVRVSAEMAVGTRLEIVDGKLRQIEEIVRREVPEMSNMVTQVGGSWRTGQANEGDVRIALVPVSERTRSSEQIAADLRKPLSVVSGVTIRTRPGRGLFILRMGAAGSERLEVEVRGHDLATADALAKQVKTMLEGIDGVTDARVSRESGSPEQVVIVDRAKAADLKVSVERISRLLETALSGTRASNYREDGDEYRILVKLKDAEKLSLDQVLDLTLVNSEGTKVSLRNVVRFAPREGPILVERKNQQRLIMVTANFEGRDLGSMIEEVREGLKSIAVPEDFTIVPGGDFEEQQKARYELLIGLGLALILVYMVMACLYESLRDPFVVMFSVPLAAIGVVLALLLTDTTFNIQSFIGCIMLAGIVVNNAILLVDQTNLLRRRDDMELRAAIEEAGRRRLRPILMTALTTILGLVPLALGMGEGGETQAPLARAVIGGLLSSTVITLVVVPVIYSIFEALRNRENGTDATA